MDTQPNGSHSSTLSTYLSQNIPSSLENLPRELRRHLLSLLDLHALKSLVHASPDYHAQYLADRRYILTQALHNTLERVAIDAFTVHLCTRNEGPTQDIINTLEFLPETMSAQYPALSGGILEEVLLRTATTARATPLVPKTAIPRHEVPYMNNLSEEDVVAMTAFYFHTVAPVRDRFADYTFARLRTTFVSSPGPPQPPALSPTEALRFVRALYIYQLLCIFTEPHAWARRQDSRTTVVENVFRLLEAWEVEQVLSVSRFAQGVHKIGVVEQGRPPIGVPDGDPDWVHWEDVDTWIGGLSSCDLSLLRTVLFDAKEDEYLTRTIHDHASHAFIPALETQSIMANSPDRAALMEDDAPLPFRGDVDLGSVPLTWTLMWSEDYGGYCGRFIPYKVGAAGYVFWDARTLCEVLGVEESGIRAAVEEAWLYPCHHALNWSAGPTYGELV